MRQLRLESIVSSPSAQTSCDYQQWHQSCASTKLAMLQRQQQFAVHHAELMKWIFYQALLQSCIIKLVHTDLLEAADIRQPIELPFQWNHHRSLVVVQRIFKCAVAPKDSLHWAYVPQSLVEGMEHRVGAVLPVLNGLPRKGRSELQSFQYPSAFTSSLSW